MELGEWNNLEIKKKESEGKKAKMEERGKRKEKKKITIEGEKGEWREK